MTTNAIFALLGLDASIGADPAVIAVEAAIHAQDAEPASPLDTALRARDMLPINATDLIRGIAMGFALMLAGREIQPQG